MIFPCRRDKELKINLIDLKGNATVTTVIRKYQTKMHYQNSIFLWFHIDPEIQNYSQTYENANLAFTATATTL